MECTTSLEQDTLHAYEQHHQAQELAKTATREHNNALMVFVKARERYERTKSIDNNAVVVLMDALERYERVKCVYDSRMDEYDMAMYHIGLYQNYPQRPPEVSARYSLANILLVEGI